MEAEYRHRAEMFPGAPPADALLGRVGLHGWQMTAIIRARYLGSRVVILDEPTSSLDAGERRMLHDNLRRMARDGIAIFYVSHFLEDVLDVCDDVTVLRDGRVALGRSAFGLSERDLLVAMTGDVGGGRCRSSRRRVMQSRRIAQVSSFEDFAAGASGRSTLRSRSASAWGSTGLKDPAVAMRSRPFSACGPMPARSPGAGDSCMATPGLGSRLASATSPVTAHAR